MKYAAAMRYGGQLVEASECNHGDFEYLKPLCPECSEPVYLRVGGDRLSPKGNEYKIGAHWCHYKNIAANAICEKRVNSYTPKELQRIAAQAQGQRLKLIQRWIWEILVKYQDEQIDRDERSSDPLFHSRHSYRSHSALFGDAYLSGFDLVHEKYCETIAGKNLVFIEKTINNFVDNWIEGKTIAIAAHPDIKAVSGEMFGVGYYTSDQVPDFLKKLSRVNLLLHKKICKEAWGFLHSGKAKDIFRTVMACEMSENCGLTRQDIVIPGVKYAGNDQAQIDLKGVLHLYGMARISLVMKICSINWVEEFRVLQPSKENQLAKAG